MKLNVENFSMWLMAYNFFPAIEKFYKDPENMEAFENWLKERRAKMGTDITETEEVESNEYRTDSPGNAQEEGAYRPPASKEGFVECEFDLPDRGEPRISKDGHYAFYFASAGLRDDLQPEI